jgi:type VI secretion system secreted protein VgrG
MHSFQVDGSNLDLRIVRFDGTEGLSELYRFDVVVTTSDRSIAPSSVLGSRALLTMTAGESVRHEHGIVSRDELGEEGKRRVA